MSDTAVQTNHERRSFSEILVDKELTATEATLECYRQYARERPEAVALWALGIGFLLGWKLKPW